MLAMLSSKEHIHEVVLCVKGLGLTHVNTEEMPQFALALRNFKKWK